MQKELIEEEDKLPKLNFVVTDVDTGAIVEWDCVQCFQHSTVRLNNPEANLSQFNFVIDCRYCGWGYNISIRK